MNLRSEAQPGAASSAAASQFFLCRLVPPRPTFPLDMTEKERAVMREHSAYWEKLLRAGKVVVYGPVEDPQGAWGLAIVRVADEKAVREIEDDDPAIRSGIGMRYERLTMRRAMLGS